LPSNHGFTGNAFDTTGKFLGQITDASNKALVNPGLWDMVFGGGGPSGATGTLYLTAGGSNQPNFPAGGSTTSVFASVIPAAAARPKFLFESLGPKCIRHVFRGPLHFGVFELDLRPGELRKHGRIFVGFRGP
jgi:hypothetical protein